MSQPFIPEQGNDMQTTEQSESDELIKYELRALTPLSRWKVWKPHFAIPKNTQLVMNHVREAFDWLPIRSVKGISFHETSEFTYLQWNSLGYAIRERYIRRIQQYLPSDATILRCEIASFYQDAHAAFLWSMLHRAPSQITVVSALSETVRLLLFYGTCFNSIHPLMRTELIELERMLALYETGIMPIGVAPDKTLYVVTG